MKLLLGSQEYIKAVNQDYQIQIGLNNEFNEFDEDIITKIVDEAVQFKTERDNCTNYLIYGKIESLMSDDFVFNNFTLNDTNYQITLGYTYGYEPLSTFQYNVTGANGTTLSVTQNQIFLTDDIVLLYKDSNTIFVQKVLDSNPNLVTLDSIPTGITITDYKLIPAVANYKRIFKSLYTDNYLKFYNSGFGVNIFNNPITQFNSFKNLNLSGLTDVFGLPLTEVVLFINKPDNVYGNYYKSTNAVETNRNVVDVVQYDLNNLNLTVLDTMYYGFTNDNAIGQYQYDAWIKIVYKCYSDHIINVTENTSFDYPDYAFIFSDGDIVYKDLLSVGFFEENTNGIDYPFINNLHYLYNDIKFIIRKQPFVI